MGEDQDQKITAAVCVYQPDRVVLETVLQRLENQSLPRAEYELLLVDNASEPPLDRSEFSIFLGAHGARLVRCRDVGLVNARLTAVREALGELIVFVDDDNLLDPDYLEKAATLSRAHPHLGAWGAGCIRAKYEVQPPPEWSGLLHLLALKEFQQPKWTNVHDHMGCAPIGAGLCVRTSVARRYAAALAESPARGLLDRKGPELLSGGDVDLALTALDMGMGMGVFPELKLTHFIPRDRVQLDYLLRLEERVAFSLVVLKAIRQGVLPRPKWSDSVIWTLRWLALGGVGRSALRSHLRGAARGREFVRDHPAWFPCPTVQPGWHLARSAGTEGASAK